MSRSTHPQTAWGGLHPFFQHLQQLGAISVVAQDGWEADDCVGAVCAVLEGELVADAAAAIIEGMVTSSIAINNNENSAI